MKLNLREPSLVFAGAWNPAIISPQWVAKNVFDVAPGQNIDLQLVHGNAGELISFFVKGVGFSCTTERLEIRTSNNEQEGIESAVTSAEKVIRLLAHTPVHGIGINFTFLDVIVPNKYSDLFDTSEKISNDFEIERQSFSTEIRIFSGIRTVIVRNIDKDGYSISFNFHKDIKRIADIGDHIKDNFVKYRDWAIRFCKERYDVDVDGVLTFNTPQGESQP